MEDKKVEVSKEQLDELIAQNKKLIDDNRLLSEAINTRSDSKESKTLAPVEITDRTVRILFLDGKAVQAFHNRGTDERPIYVYEKPDKNRPSEMVLYVDVLFFGKEEPETVLYNDLLHNGIREECKILKMNETPWKSKQGATVQKIVREYATEETGVMVPIEVLGKTRTFNVQLPDGKKMDIHENYVNM